MFLLQKQIVLLLACLGLCQASLLGCPAGYISSEAVVRCSPLILQVEVLSVGNAPPLTGTVGSSSKAARQGALARVRVLKALKGHASQRQFTVIGGPYQTCQPGEHFVHFSKGSQIFLALDAPLKSNEHTVVITTQGRILEKKPDEILALMEKSRLHWQRAVDRYRRTAPAAMKAAEQVLAASHGDPSKMALEALVFAELSCLRLLLNDPDHLPALETESTDAGLPSGNIFSTVSTLAPLPSLPGYHYTAQPVTHFAPRALNNACKARASSHGHEARAFHRSLLLALLRDELKLPATLAEAAAALPSLSRTFEEPTPDPFWIHFPRSDIGSQAFEESLRQLLMLADPEPDSFVWGTFGIGVRPPPLLPEVFVPYLQSSHAMALADKPHAFDVLLSLPHPAVVPVIRAGIRANPRRARAAFEFFAVLKAAEDLDFILGAVEVQTAEILATPVPANPADPYQIDPKKWQADEVEKLRQLLRRHLPEADALSKRLDALAGKLAAAH